ncbi:MAG TPA: hypothetical protein VKU38_05970 [Ktedonobacteraceae bacterium]|nr:hypothetical protein [Ktedonobacteraceae bacterium]
MGQYQQWLHYRDVDRLLRAQLDELIEEFAQLHNREQLLQQMLHPIDEHEQAARGETPSLLQSNNEILHALMIGLNGHTNHTQHPELSPSTNGTTEMAPYGTTEGPSARYTQANEPTAAISQALFAQGSLPPSEEQFAPDPVVGTNEFRPLLNRNTALPPIPHTPHSESMLLPEDLGAFIEEHTQTEPRMELPWWLRNAALINTNGPIDQESMRTNRLIQRWIERWGRHPNMRELPEARSENTEKREDGEDTGL